MTHARVPSAVSAATAQSRGARPPTRPVSEAFGARSLSWRALCALVTPADAAALRALVEDDQPLSRGAADALAAAVQRWAHAHGATHYTHWFHPLTSAPAEKHDSFVGIEHSNEGDPRALEDFSGSKLIQAEPDASSFPSGGLRNTAEARGYTVWDPTSPLFISDDEGVRTLCIPSAFISWKGHALDHKLPLLRARRAVEAAALRLLQHTDGPPARRVTVTLGPEQEYFLVDRALLSTRPDILAAGRALAGRPPVRHQQLEDHYFGAIPARVSAFIAEAEAELWALGVPLKTRHNEVAPAQFETAPVFEEVNVACDHNALTMDVFRRVAARHGLACLLHEKPFAGVNGSGKHNNWALSTDTGVNLLDPGDAPHEDPRFLLVLSSVLLALHTHAAVLRATIAGPGNDHRLGANEAPPPILSAYLGAALDAAVVAVIDGGHPAVSSAKAATRAGHGLHLKRDPGDRNRTSPFAFTGNKFEFRAVGSSENCAWPQAVLNAAVADAMHEVSGRIEARLAAGEALAAARMAVAREVLKATRAVCFDGDGYAQAWRDEAARRGLPILQDSASALAVLHNPAATGFLSAQGVLDADEVLSRAEVLGERYVKQLDIEARKTLELVHTLIVPAVERQLTRTGEAATWLKGVHGAGAAASAARLARLGDRLSGLVTGADALAAEVDALESQHGLAAVQAAASGLRAAMDALRAQIDAAEGELADDLWPLARARELLFLGV